jgi:hypothetical protein
MPLTIEAQALRHDDLFALPHGSVYQTVRRGPPAGPVQAKLWCAHPPDAVTFTPPLIDISSAQPVQLLGRGDTRGHTGHAGYVRAVFAQEMDRRHQERMTAVVETSRRAAAEARQRARAGWPWWKKLLR